MLKENELIGAITIYRQEVRPFTDKQIELVTNFAAQAVIAIENTRLLNELRQRTDDLSESLEQQTATSEVLKVISSSPGELEPVFQAMLENATRTLRGEFGNLRLLEGDRRRFLLRRQCTMCRRRSRDTDALDLTGSPSHRLRPAAAMSLRRKQVLRCRHARTRAIDEGAPSLVGGVDFGRHFSMHCRLMPMLKDEND